MAMSTLQAALPLVIIRFHHAAMKRVLLDSPSTRSYGFCHDIMLFIHASESKTLCEKAGRALISQNPGPLKVMKDTK